MNKSYYSLGLMSGTSMDGVDASIIHSDGTTKYEAISNKYFEYNKELYKDLTSIRDKIASSKDLKTLQNELKFIEKKITLFHAKAVDEIIRKSKTNIDFIGFHGQTIFHSAKEKISEQLGDGDLLSKHTKKTVIYNFRQNDLKNGGQGAPLTPIFHKLLKNKNEVIRIQLKEYKEHKLIDLRVWYEDEEGEYKPTKKGISFNRNLAINISNAITEVLSE